MSQFNPKELVEYAEQLAEMQASEMNQEECVLMVRSFTEAMAEWQPSVKEFTGSEESAVQLAVACLTLSHLFQKAFCSAYSFTEKRLEAQEAIEKALGGSL